MRLSAQAQEIGEHMEQDKAAPRNSESDGSSVASAGPLDIAPKTSEVEARAGEEEEEEEEEEDEVENHDATASLPVDTSVNTFSSAH
jgi:hypothetical protein